jgi:hypothetical protein
MDVLDVNVKVRSYGKQRFKSRGEEQIARLLERNGINYWYEYPLAVIDNGMTRLWYPDFHLPGYGMIVEYFGVNGKPCYDEKTRHKLEVYKQNGIEGLFLNEASFKGDWPGRIMNQIEGILRGRVERFYDRASRR